MKQNEFERRQAMMDAYEVFKCSGSLDHDFGCSGDCGTEKLDELDIAINKEKDRWAELGIPNQGSIPNTQIPGIPIDTFHLENAFTGVMNLLIEKGVATKEELDNAAKEVILYRMTIIRERNEAAILKARARGQIATPDLSQIEVPDYIKRRMH